MLAMLEFLVLCGLAILANWIVKKVMTKKITMSQTAKQSVRLRKTYRALRLTIKILFAVFAFVEFIFLMIFLFDNNSELLVGIVYLIVPPYFLLAMYVFSSMSLPVSGMTIDDIKEKEFALYLRGFSSDDYFSNHKLDAIYETGGNYHRFGRRKKEEESEYIEIELADSWGIKNKITVEKSFTEYSFCSAFRDYCKMPVYSVGMTKELMSPEGSKRIYLDDATWQSDVAELIKRAKYVFVLVNPSDSCIWEIFQCQEHAMEKSYFFVHNESDLKELCEKLDDKTPKCLLDLKEKSDVTKHVITCMNNGENKIIRYVNTKKGFKDLFGLILKKEV